MPTGRPPTQGISGHWCSRIGSHHSWLLHPSQCSQTYLDQHGLVALHQQLLLLALPFLPPPHYLDLLHRKEVDSNPKHFARQIIESQEKKVKHCIQYQKTNQQTHDVVDRDSGDLQNTHILLDQAEQKEEEVAGAQRNLKNMEEGKRNVPVSPPPANKSTF